MNLTLKEAKEKHVEMWDLMSRLTEAQIHRWDYNIMDLKQLVLALMGAPVFSVCYNCFLCEYSKPDINKCTFCPAIWKVANYKNSINPCLNSYFGEFTDLMDYFKNLKDIFKNSSVRRQNFRQKYKFLCEQIRDVEWKE